MILTIYLVSLLFWLIIIMIICRIFPRFVKEFGDVNIPILILFCLTWPIVLFVGLIGIIYYKFYQVVNFIDKHKKS